MELERTGIWRCAARGLPIEQTTGQECPHDGGIAHGLVSGGGQRGCGECGRLLPHDRTPAESEVSVENILAVHRERTIERIANQSSVLLIQDGTDLNFATHGACEGLGLIGRNRSSEGSLGLHLHSTLAVSASGVPLGVMQLELDAPALGTSHRKSDSNHKTQRWIRGLQDSAQACAKGAGCVLHCGHGPGRRCP